MCNALARLAHGRSRRCHPGPQCRRLRAAAPTAATGHGEPGRSACLCPSVVFPPSLEGFALYGRRVSASRLGLAACTSRIATSDWVASAGRRAYLATFSAGGPRSLAAGHPVARGPRHAARHGDVCGARGRHHLVTHDQSPALLRAQPRQHRLARLDAPGRHLSDIRARTPEAGGTGDRSLGGPQRQNGTDAGGFGASAAGTRSPEETPYGHHDRAAGAAASGKGDPTGKDECVHALCLP